MSVFEICGRSERGRRMNKQVIIAIGAFMLLIVTAISIFLLVNRDTPSEFTGGSGQPEAGTLILTGYETPSNDSSKIPLGTFLNSDQQLKVRSTLETLLHQEGPQPEYEGTIIPESVKVDYTTNIIQFKVQIYKPKVIYIVNYNTLNDEITIQDESGQTLDSFHE